MSVLAKRHRARHRGASRGRKVAAQATKVAAVTGVAAAVPVVGATAAEGASTETWDRLAQCESSGNWSINTGNGYYGGLQFAPSTWSGFGGTQYAEYAHQATKEQQIAIAEKVLQVQGWGAWPACSAKLGLTEADKSGGSTTTEESGSTSSGGSESTTTSTRSTEEAASRSAERTTPESGSSSEGPAEREPAEGASYTIKSGDSLYQIAVDKGVDGGWEALWKLNRSLVGDDPHLIFPGEMLALG